MTEQTLPLNLSYVDAINAAYGCLNSLEKRIADYILENGVRCRHMSARELAQACGCSGATVVRFARKLNYDGFADLKHHIRSPGAAADDICLSSGEKTSAMMQKALMYATHAIQSTVQQTREELLDFAARAIMNAHCVQLCAMGSAAGVALSACSQFLSFGIRADFPMDELQQLRSAACLKQGDVLIGINYNNAAKGVADAFLAAKQAGATTILITAEQRGVLSRYADVVFHTPTRRPDNSLNFSTTTLCQSMVLQLLILRVWQLDPSLFQQESTRLRGYTKLKLYDPSIEKLAVTHSTQEK